MRTSTPLAALAVLTTALGAQNARLSGPLAQVGAQVRGDVTSFQPALGVGRVVYRADQELDEVFGLYAARLDLVGGPVALAAGLTATGSITEDFQVSPGGECVVFEHQPAGADVGHLYVTATSGAGLPLLLDGPAHFHPPFLFSLATGRVVYRRVQPGGLVEHVSAPLDGSAAPVPLHAPLGSVYDPPQLSRDGIWVVYRANHAADALFELYVVPADGSAPPLRLDRETSGSGIHAFAIAPDGANVVFRTSGGLFSAARDGSRRVDRLDDPLAASPAISRFEITSDSRRVVFLGHGRALGRLRLYAATITGRLPWHGQPGAIEREPDLLTPMPHFGDVVTYPAFQLTADGAHAVYAADARVDFRTELFRVRTDGSGPPELLTPAAGAAVYDFVLASDRTHLVFHGDLFAGAGLYRLPLAGGTPTLLEVVAGVEGLSIGPDSAFVFFLSAFTGARALHAVPLDGRHASRSLNGPLPAMRTTQYDFVTLPVGRALYRADQRTHEVVELFEAFAGRARPR
ncbi:MAG TPA: hypothetical protein VF530_04525 [Planctomycetota bacterium]